jgi:hypothetical protein
MSLPPDCYTAYQTAAVFKHRMATLRAQDFWTALETDIQQEEREQVKIKREYAKLARTKTASIKYLTFTSQMVLTTGGVQAESAEEATRNTAELLAERKQLADQFKSECVTYKNEKLRPSVLSVFPLINAKTGRAIKSSGSSRRINMALASWRY